MATKSQKYKEAVLFGPTLAWGIEILSYDLPLEFCNLDRVVGCQWTRNATPATSHVVWPL